jgi:phosphatidylinositol alpha-1,6-mannosyltransferase
MPSEKEGFGIVFLEAAFFSKPSIAGNHGGSPEVVTAETGALVRHGDSNALAAQLRSMIGNREQIRSAGEKANARLRTNFLFEHFHRNVRALLEATEG